MNILSKIFNLPTNIAIIILANVAEMLGYVIISREDLDIMENAVKSFSAGMDEIQQQLKNKP